MKKICLILPLIMAFTPFLNVCALKEDIYLKNNNGVEITEEQYYYLLNFYNQNDIDNMSKEKIELEISRKLEVKNETAKYIKTLNYIGMNGKVENTMDIEISEEEYENPISPLSVCEATYAVDCWETTYKKLYMTAWAEADSSSTDLRIVLLNIWKIMPKIRSFDVIGIRYYNYVPYDAWGDQYFDTATWSYSYGGTNMNIQSNGIGISQNIPNDDITFLYNRIVVDGNTTSSTLGVYGSYQHATSDISLAQSKNYSFANSMGGVFAFNSGVSSYYDGMQGVKFVY